MIAEVFVALRPVWVVGVAAVGALVASVAVGVSPAAADTTVTTPGGLEAAFAAGGTVILGGDITISDGSAPAVVAGQPVTLDLAGHSLTINSVSDDSAGIGVPVGASLTIQSSASGGTLTVTGGRFAAGIGGGGGGINGGTGGSVEMSGGTVDATGGQWAAGIGGGDGGGCGGGGGSVEVTGGTVTATGSQYAAGIGGGHGDAAAGSGGSVEVSGGTVTATGGQDAPGIGSGFSDGGGGAGGSVQVSGGTVTATGGFDGAGIGGGAEGNGGTVEVSGGTVTATGGSSAAGIGGGGGGNGGTVAVFGGTVTATGCQQGAGIGGGFCGAGGTVTVQVGGTVTAAGSPGEEAIGPGGCNGSFGSFGALVNAGLLVLPAGSSEVVPSGVPVVNSGTVQLEGALSGAGSVDNTGRILPTGSGTVDDHGQGSPGHLTVETHNFALSFDVNGGDSSTPATQYVYAATVNDANQTLPTASNPQGAFLGWFTAAHGGTQITDSSDLAGVFGPGPVAATLYAHYQVATHLVVTAQSRILRGHAFQVTIMAEDDHGDLATGDNSALRFVSNDPNAVLPPNGSVSLQDGRATIDVTFYRHARNDAIRVYDGYGNVGQSNPVDVI